MFDVLAYVAIDTTVISREERVSIAIPKIHRIFEDKNQRELIKFILDKYVEDGVRELSLSKINALIKLKYGSASDAVERFGAVSSIKETFIDCQKYLYI